MKTRHTSIFLLLWALLFSVPLSAQDMTVRSMNHDPLDQTANLSENMYKDNNGEYGGLVKVKLAASGATFEGWILHEQPRGAGEYWVFMAKGSSRLTIKVSGHLPLDVNFRDYEDCIIRSQHTYVLTINVPQLMQAGPVDDGMRYLGLSVEPKNATVLVNDNPQQVDSNGEVSVLLPKGSHRYQVSALGYATKVGTVEVGDDNNTLSIRLVSTQATLRVECATKGAQVYINNFQKGTAPWSGSLASGIYQVEARLDGYRPQKQTVTLAESDNKVISIPELQMIAGLLNVDYRPLGSEVYIDGKKVGTTPNIFRNVQVGNRSVEIRKEGYQPLLQTVAIKENEQASLTGTLTAITSSSSSDSSDVKGVKITLQTDTLFERGKSLITNASKASLNKLAGMLKSEYDVFIVIQGHTDSTASDEINNELSLKQAQAVADCLISYGVPSSMIKNISGCGSSKPISDNSTADGRHKNRRIEIYMYPTAVQSKILGHD